MAVCVSVPLRGYGFEILPPYEDGTFWIVFPSPYGDMVLKYETRRTFHVHWWTVSVPLRGYGFEILTCQRNRLNSSCFRPLTGFPYLSFPRRYGGSGEHASRWGRLCLAFTSVAMKVYSLRSWRPLRHTACATSPALAGEAGGTLRPLGGSSCLASPVATGEVASNASR